MGRKSFSEVLLATCLLLISTSLTSSQSGLIRSYDWRTTILDDDIPQDSAPSNPYIPSSDPSSPYELDDSIRYQDFSGPHSSPFYQYQNLPQPVPYVDQDISSYPREPLNMTLVRIGGFAGSGDTKGFGAYDVPKTREIKEEEDLDDDEEYQLPVRVERRPLRRYRNREGHAYPPPLPYIL